MEHGNAAVVFLVSGNLASKPLPVSCDAVGHLDDKTGVSLLCSLSLCKPKPFSCCMASAFQHVPASNMCKSADGLCCVVHKHKLPSLILGKHPSASHQLAVGLQRVA